jgi:hypothetical protein
MRHGRDLRDQTAAKASENFDNFVKFLGTAKKQPASRRVALAFGLGIKRAFPPRNAGD